MRLGEGVTYLFDDFSALEFMERELFDGFVDGHAADHDGRVPEFLGGIFDKVPHMMHKLDDQKC